MCAWTLAKGRRNSKICLEPPLLKPGEGYWRTWRTQGPRLHFLAFDQGPGPPLLGSSVLRLSPPISPLHCLRHRLLRPLPASRGLSAWDRLSDAQMGQGPRSLLTTPCQVLSRQQTSQQGSSQPYLGADSPLESLRRGRALGPFHTQVNGGRATGTHPYPLAGLGLRGTFYSGSVH